MTHNLLPEEQHQLVQALKQFAQSVQKDPAIANCSMCDGTGTWSQPELRYWQNCPRCEGTGKAGSFAVVIESDRTLPPI